MANQVTRKLLSNATTTGSWFNWPGGHGAFTVTCSNYNGATVTLQVQGADGSTGIAVDKGTTDVTFTANGAGGFSLGPCLIRAAISGAVPSAGVYANATVIPVDNLR